MKKLARYIVVTILKWQVKRYLQMSKVKLVGVAGSIGKTSTKMAIATVLSSKYKVGFQSGNYNDHVTVPLVIFKEENPSSLTSIISWLGIFIRNERKIGTPIEEDVFVLELGTDGVGQIKQFDYLNLDVGVLTAIAPEHMENFNGIDDVAKEEMAIANFSEKLIFNQDLTGDYLTGQSISYGIKSADYFFKNFKRKGIIFSFDVWRKKDKLFSAKFKGISDGEIYSLLAAISVASELDVSVSDIKKSISNIKPFAGRMQLLEGLHDSVIIDDSYNSSPEAVKQALKALASLDVPQRIALLGSMNELGATSTKAHEFIGGLCNPEDFDLVVTLGVEANKYTAPSADKNGCKVVKTSSPVQAGEVIKTFLKPGSAVLVKGSQNGVFAEEAIKVLLKNPSDSTRLVRQDLKWMTAKSKQFDL